MEQYGMYMLPLQIIYKDRTYTDKVDITAEEIYERLPQEIPSTRYLMARRSGNLWSDQSWWVWKSLAVTISSGLSGTFNVVRLLGEQQTWGFVLDTKISGSVQG